MFHRLSVKKPSEFNFKMMTALVSLLFITAGCSHIKTSKQSPKNVILLIADGMGPAHIKAYRVFNDDPSTPGVDPLLFDPLLVGTLSIDNHIGHSMAVNKSGSQNLKNSSDTYYQVTDSAASATAYSAGIKSYNGAIAVDNNKAPVPTVLEVAKQKGLNTGLVATSQIVHATPAAFIAHEPSRRNYNNIADQFLDNTYNNQPMVDVFLGGGWQYFKRDDRDLTLELEQQGFDVITQSSELKTAGDKVAGLFADIGLPRVLQRTEKHPSLAEMTNAAINRLEQDNDDKGFFLMVEGSQIDWASHDNNVAGMMHEMDDFASAIKAAVSYAEKDGDTLVLVTADHETGGLSVGARVEDRDYYQFNVHPIKRMKQSLPDYAEQVMQENSIEIFLSDLGITLTELESKQWAQLQGSDDKRQIYDFLKNTVNRTSFAGWTTHGHTGVDVNLYAYGVGAEQFYGHHENTFIGQKLLNWLNNLSE